MMKNVCVFCGSNTGARDVYASAARELGQAMVKKDLGLVYGGARVGLMGAIADSVLAAGGEVIGVMPGFLVEKEIAHEDLTALRVVDSMNARKQLMGDLADGFIALPGGFGTLDEFFEVVTWTQLNMHTKPCGLLDVDGYYRQLMKFLDHAAAEQFIRAEHRSVVLVDEDPNALLGKMESFRAPVITKWMGLGN
jgi:uncharacterized protein (TIGR00730 family)